MRFQNVSLMKDQKRIISENAIHLANFFFFFFFFFFFDKDIGRNMFFSNLLINATKTKEEIKRKKGNCTVLFCRYHNLPPWLKYSKSDPDLFVPFVSKAKSQTRFGQTLWNLQVNHNSRI